MDDALERNHPKTNYSAFLSTARADKGNGGGRHEIAFGAFDLQCRQHFSRSSIFSQSFFFFLLVSY